MFKEKLQQIVTVTTMCAAGLGVLEGAEILMPDVFDPVCTDGSFKESFVKRMKQTVVILGAVSISLTAGFGAMLLTDKLLGIEYPEIDEE